MDTNNEILDAIEILADKKIGDNITKVLTGICTSVNINKNTCVMDSNGVSGTVYFYGSPPEVNGLYRIFVPSNDMSRSFIIVPPKFTVNPNLLDNWYFGNPVNQRGQTEYTAAGYTIDRWKFNNNNSDIVIDDTGIMFTAKYQYAEFEQRYEFPKNISGKQITISILADSFSGEGDFYLVIQNQTEYQTFHLSVGLNSFTTKFFDESSVLRLFIQGQNVNETNPPKIHLLAAKLELGSAQTLAHKENEKWVLNEIPDFGEQLARCQRYFFKILGTHLYGWTYSTTVANFLIPLPVTMRAFPTLKIIKNGNLNTVNGGKDISNTSTQAWLPNGISIDAITNSEVLTVGTPVTWHSVNLELSADL